MRCKNNIALASDITLSQNLLDKQSRILLLSLTVVTMVGGGGFLHEIKREDLNPSQIATLKEEIFKSV